MAVAPATALGITMKFATGTMVSPAVVAQKPSPSPYFLAQESAYLPESEAIITHRVVAVFQGEYPGRVKKPERRGNQVDLSLIHI